MESIGSSRSTNSKTPKKKICLSGCRYDVICRVAMECGFKLVADNDLWNIIWSDAPLSGERVMEMRRLQNVITASGLAVCNQRMNHFPGMYEICRKDRLGRNLNRLKKLFPRDYNFFPMTWDLPSDISDLMEYWRRHKNSTFIIKPDAGCQGKGIFLVRNLKTICPYAKCVCQLYMSQPFLIDGYKYDQRIYVLITCVDPLRIYIYNEGIARLATVKYGLPNENNIDIIFMHLTNYSLNKFSESYDPQADDGSKRKLSGVYAWMTEHGYDVQKLIDSIDDIIIKTVLCALPTLRHNYRASFPKRDRASSCFEILGFDILVDRHLRPSLVEVNHSPSFNLDLPVDNDVKTELLKDTFSIIYLGAKSSKLQNPPTRPQRNNILVNQRPRTPYGPNVTGALLDQFSHESKSLGNFRLIFEEENPGEYSRFIDKEYCSTEDDLFLKKRPQPALANALIHWPTEPKMKTSLKVSKTGLMYVDTRPCSAVISDPQEFMKFKFNSMNSSYFPEYCAQPSKPKKRRAKRVPGIKGSMNLSEGSAVSGSTSSPHSRQKDEMDEENARALLPLRSLSPRQRVQAALDKLRQKKMENYKMTPQLNDGILRGTTASSNNDVTSPYLEDALRIEHKAKKKSQKPKHSSNRDNKFFKPCTNLVEFDASKLPSVLQQFAVSQAPWNSEPRCTPSTPTRLGPVTNFIQQWVRTENVKGMKPKKRKTIKPLQTPVSSNNDGPIGLGRPGSHKAPKFDQRQESSGDDPKTDREISMDKVQKNYNPYISIPDPSSINDINNNPKPKSASKKVKKVANSNGNQENVNMKSIPDS